MDSGASERGGGGRGVTEEDEVKWAEAARVDENEGGFLATGGGFEAVKKRDEAASTPSPQEPR
jgi:hypothetical protein